MQEDIEMKDETNKINDEEKPTEDEKYIKFKKLQKELELLEIQENYIKEETNNLKMQYARGKQEIKTILGTPLMIGQFTRYSFNDRSIYRNDRRKLCFSFIKFR